MRRYREYLECKYESLELTSIDEKLSCSALEYINLTLVKVDKQKRNLSEEDLLQEKKRGYTVTLSEALDVEGEKKKVILIKGDPGMGKTTLAINICKRWTEGSLLQSYDAVILLPLRDPGIQKANTIGDLLLTPDVELREHILKEVTKNFGESICFILEGYDELPESYYRSSIFTNLKELLPKCTLIYTSRPEACDKIASPSKIIKIAGFEKYSVDKYITKTFDHVKDGQDLSSQLKSQIHSNAIVRGLLHVPINVAIVCMIFFHYSMLPETHTQLYTLLCIRLILRHITTRTINETKVKELHSLDDLPKDIAEQFSQLCLIAYKGVGSDKLIFSFRDLQSFGVVINKGENLGLLVTAPSTSLYGTEMSYNFLHKTVQEFCAAWYISRIMSPQDHLECINTNWDSNGYFMVWMFYSGITGLKDAELLKCMLSCMLVKSRLTEMRTADLLEYVYEAQNSEVCQIVGDHLSDNINIDSRCFNEGLMTCVVDYFLSQYKCSIRQITIKETDYNFQTLQTLCEVENSKQLSSHCNIKLTIKIIDSWLGKNFENYQALLSLLKRQFPVSELHFYYDFFHYYKFFGLANLNIWTEIFTANNTLRVLDFTKTTVTSELATCLGALRNIKLNHFGMKHCRVGNKGIIDKIGEMLYHNNSIVSVDLSYNSIEDDGVEKLVYHLSHNNIQHLNLGYNDITVIGAGHLIRLIAADYSTLTSIELSYNYFLGDEGVNEILSSLTVTMEHIGLRRVMITSSSSHIIAPTLHKVKSIGFDQLDDCELICDGLANTTVLKKLELGCVSGSFGDNYFSAIGRNVSIEKLQLDNVTDEHATNIAKLLEQTQTLTEMTIIMKRLRISPSSQVLLQLANSLTVNKSVKILKYCDRQMERATILEFLEQLKQADTLQELYFAIVDNGDDQFIHNVEKIVQQINHVRSSRGVTSVFKVNIASCSSFEFI